MLPTPSTTECYVSVTVGSWGRAGARVVRLFGNISACATAHTLWAIAPERIDRAASAAVLRGDRRRPAKPSSPLVQRSHRDTREGRRATASWRSDAAADGRRGGADASLRDSPATSNRSGTRADVRERLPRRRRLGGGGGPAQLRRLGGNRLRGAERADDEPPRCARHEGPRLIRRVDDSGQAGPRDRFRRGGGLLPRPGSGRSTRSRHGRCASRRHHTVTRSRDTARPQSTAGAGVRPLLATFFASPILVT